jgi:hypothetical protein
MSGKRRAAPRRVDGRGASGPGGRPGSGKPGSGGYQGGGGRGPGGKGSGGRAIEPAPRFRFTPALLGWISTGVVVVIVLVLVLVNVTKSKPPAATGGPVQVPASVVSEVTSVPSSVLDQVGIAGDDISTTALDNPVNPIETAHPSGGNGLADTGGKPVVFYFGALWCPICATERWSMLVALSRFGTFTGLLGAQSSATDSYPNTQTWDFSQATYTSPYIVFTPDEFQDMNRNNLMNPNAAEQVVLSAWDAPEEKFPFLTIGDKYIAGIPGWLDPQLLQGLSRSQIAQTLTQPTNPLGSALDANANYLSAAICSVDGMKPASVCTSSGVTAAATQLKKAPAAQSFG